MTLRANDTPTFGFRFVQIRESPSCWKPRAVQKVETYLNAPFGKPPESGHAFANNMCDPRFWFVILLISPRGTVCLAPCTWLMEDFPRSRRQQNKLCWSRKVGGCLAEHAQPRGTNVARANAKIWWERGDVRHSWLITFLMCV